METRYGVQFRQSGGLNVAPVAPFFYKVLQRCYTKKSVKSKAFSIL